MNPFTIAQLRALSDDELIRQHDRIATEMKVEIGGNLNYFRDEIVRRDAERVNQQMVKFTRGVTIMTAVILGLTAVNVILVALQLAAAW